MQFAFLSHISPVRLSVTVPSPSSVNLGFGQATPLCNAPSSSAIVPYDVVWPVLGRLAMTLSTALPETPEVAVMVVEPAALEAAVASPVALTVARVPSDEVQLTDDVMSFVLLSE